MRIAILLTMFLLPVFGQDDTPASPSKSKEEQNETKQVDVLSLFKLGGEYYKKGDYEAAFQWFTAAAEQGFPGADYNLGHMCKNGRGVPQDYKQAFQWYRKAANRGHPQARYELGVLYQNGQGVPQDFVQALMWYNLAASQTTGEDRERSANNRDLIAQKMTSEQIAEAQRLAREFKPKNSGSQ